MSRKTKTLTMSALMAMLLLQHDRCLIATACHVTRCFTLSVAMLAARSSLRRGLGCSLAKQSMNVLGSFALSSVLESLVRRCRCLVGTPLFNEMRRSTSISHVAHHANTKRSRTRDIIITLGRWRWQHSWLDWARSKLKTPRDECKTSERA